MRVGILVYGDLDERSGGFLYDRRVVEHLRERGDDVVVFSLPERGYLRSTADNLDGSLPRRIRAADLDVLLQDELCHPSLAWLNRRLGVDAPVVAVVHHIRAAEARSVWRNALVRRLERAYLRSVDAFVCNSETTRRAVSTLVGGDAAGTTAPSVVAYPAGDRFGTTVSAARVRERARDGPLRVVCVGNVTRRKNLETLLAGLARIRRPWELVVVGSLAVDAEYVAELRSAVDRLRLDGRVRFAGRLDDAALAALYERSHLFAMPSTHEGFGIAYVEAMGFGLPVVASAAGGASELVADRTNGYLVDPADPTEVTDAVAPLCRNRKRLARMGVAALATYEAHPTWAETGARVGSFLDSLAAGSDSA
ncbi:glycosyltransferase family 4 protein [Haloprofundus salinisoli]|uniref:glycosyltransferase family 4 protein n=1 Tax=Haloprofundus salinisoli TaxID=2876193 RepID=UPI001CCFDB73|nr:glycosyltransferase family 4 protein [Haloprofundus salinisoli]